MSSSSGKQTPDEESSGHNFLERANSLEQVRKKLRSGWRNDDAVLNQYFQSCFTNWKVYKGKRTPQQVLKLQAIYKQAIYGDNPDAPPLRMESAEGLKWNAWHKLSGTPKEMAKRRFITFLAEIDPLLIDVMPDEKPPIGFPLDRKGIPVCAKCNTKVGCLRPLLDQNKMDLKKQLFENEDLQNPKKFAEWVRNALVNQRCIWGVHKAISRAEARPFMAWFDKDENRGFYPYDSISVMLLIHELIHHHHEVCFDMMINKDEVDQLDYNAQATKTIKLKEVYEQLAGEEFIFYLACERENDLCNQRRLADGGRNHTHPIEIDPPTSTNQNTLAEAVELRLQCQKIGLNPCTGVVTDIAQRCEIYRARIAKHFEALQAAAIAKLRNEKRHVVHAAEKSKVKELSRNMLAKQCWDVCQMNMVDSALLMVRRGCNPNEESPRGITPLSMLVLNDAQIEQVEELLQLKANINLVNRYGFSSLMLACRLNNSKMVHILMRSGVSALAKDEKVGRTALHWCVIHGCEEMVKIIAEYLKEGVGDSMRVTRFLDAQTNDGETALMLAARIRNGIMCYVLTSIGANPNMRNNKGRTAAYIARQSHWVEIADWLEKKVGAGMAKVETFSDLQFEKQHRFGLIKVKDLIHNFGRTYLLLMQNRIGLHPLGCPFVARESVREKGERAVAEQRQFMDNHQLYILKRDIHHYLTGKATQEEVDEESKQLKELRTIMKQMLELLRAGMTNPNTELEPKPLAWTPLMCAVALNDIRSIKLMIREGANPNHPNRDGTTAVMVAAQLQNVEALAELLLNKGDLDALDSQGYNVAAYATSLPLPTVIDRDSVGVLLDGDVDGPKPMSSMELIKLALAGGLRDLKEILIERENSSKPEALDQHFRVLQLLEQYGLSNIQTERNVHDSVRNAAWRVKEPELFQHRVDPEAQERERERQKKLLYMQLKKKAEEKTADEASLEDLRCPICTLQVPCAHFFKVEILKDFLQKKIEAARLAAAGEEEAAAAAAADGLSKRPRKRFISAKKLRVANRVQELLDETLLSNRNTDRSILLMKQFRGRELAVENEKEHQLLLLQEARRLAEEEEALREGEDSDDEEEQRPITASDEAAAIPPLLTMDVNSAVEESVVSSDLLTPSAAADFEVQTQSPAPVDDSLPAQPSKLRTVKRLPSKQDLHAVPDGPSLALSEASVQASDVVEPSTALVVIPEENSSSDNAELAIVGTANVDTEGMSQALVVVPPPEEAMTLVPVLKSALKTAMTEVADLSSAMVEFKKKRRVKFYFADEADGEQLVITDGSELGTDGTPALDLQFNDLMITEDASVSSGSTASTVTDPALGSVLVTAPSPRSKVVGIAMTETPSPVLTSSIGTSAAVSTMEDPFADIATVSTSTTLTTIEGRTDDDSTAAVPTPALAPTALSDGLASLQDGEIPEHRHAKDLVHPIPPHNRRVFMFTKNSMDRQGRTDGLVHIPPRSKPESGTNSDSAALELKKKNKKKLVKPRFIRSDPIKVEVSGWIFVSLADIQSDINPVSTVSIALESWGGMVENIRETLFEEWLSDIRLEPVVSLKTWQPEAPRCTVCGVGFVRFRSSIESFRANPIAYIQLYGSQNISSTSQNTENVHLCLACALRKQLFLQSKRFFPEDSNSADQQVAWPFMHRKNVTVNTLPQPTFSFISGPNPPSGAAVGGAAIEGIAMDGPRSPIGEAQTSGRISLPNSVDAGSTDSVSAMSWTTGLNSGMLPDSQALMMFPSTSLQAAQSSSPVKSQRLQDLDARELWEKTHTVGGIQQLLDQDSDLSSVQSNDASMVSNITDSVDVANQRGDQETISVASTVSAVNPGKKPKELALLPYLIAKGHYEEAERTLRIALGKRAVDEGEGLKILISLLTLQAEMYKSMGLWPLALAIYFDCVDLNASLMGYNDDATQASIVLLIACLRKMQCVQLAGKYVKSLCQMVQRETLKSARVEIVEKIKKQDSIQVKEFLTHNSIWTEHLKPNIVAHNPLQRRFQSVVGMGGFYSLLTAQDGYSVVARISFYKFCEDVDAKTLGLFAHFVDFCFRLRLCDEAQMYKYLIQHVVQKQLAKALVAESEVARLYRTVTSKAHIDLVVDFLNYGVQPSVVVFDAMLKIALEKLLKVYRIFLLFEPAGSMLREQRMDIIAEAYDVSALIIQTTVRRRQARKIVEIVRVEKQAIEAKRQEALALRRKRAARY